MAKVSPKEAVTARGILAGLSVTEAMRAAKYTDSYIRKGGNGMVDRLRDKGLLPTDDDVRAIKDKVLAILQESAEVVATAMVTAATAGDVVAQKAVLDRAAGPVPKRHEVSMEDVGAVVDDLLADAARELDPDTYERLRQTWAKRIEARKRP